MKQVLSQKTHNNNKGTNAKKAIINFYNDGDMDGCKLYT